MKVRENNISNSLSRAAGVSQKKNTAGSSFPAVPVLQKETKSNAQEIVLPVTNSAPQLKTRDIITLSPKNTKVETAPSAKTNNDDEVMQLLLVKVTTAKNNFGDRVIIKVEIAERAPTQVSGSQGDHTIAEALMELMLVSFIKGKTHKETAKSIELLLAHLDQQARTKFKNDNDTFTNLDIKFISQLINNYNEMAFNNDTDGEDLNNMLESILDAFIRLWNKRAGSAYSKKEGKTTGGGGGPEEKKAKKELLLLSEKTKTEGSSEELASDMANHILTMIDFKVTGKEDLIEAAKHISAAIEIAITISPDIEFNYYDLMVFVVELFIKRAGLSKEQGELLFDLVHSRVTPYDNEDYEDFEGFEVEEMRIDNKKSKKEQNDQRPRFFINHWDGRSLPEEVYRYFAKTGQNSFIINNSMALIITKYNEHTGQISFIIRPLGG